MRRSLLAVAVLLASASLSAAQAAMSPARRAEIDAQVSQWTEAKARGRRATDALLARIAADRAYDAASFRKAMADTWRMLEGLEQGERRRQQKLEERLATTASLGIISGTERAVRSEAVDRLFQLRMLSVYGDILPRILDESVRVNNRDIGRHYAGADWRQVLTEDEMRLVHVDYRAATGLSLDLLDDPANSARARR